MFTHLARSHHHATTDSVERVRRDTGTSRHSPAEKERSQEAALKRADEDNGLDRVVHAKVETAVDDDTGNRWTETTVETSDTVRGQRLLVNVDETVELALAALLGRLGVVGETGTGVVERVDEEQRRGAGGLFTLSQSQLASFVIPPECHKKGKEHTPPEAKLPAIHFPYPSRSFLNANMDL